MKRMQQAVEIHGPVGKLQASITTAKELEPESVKTMAVVCHPHPLHEGTMDNKVVTTLARTLLKMSIPSVRFNYRGVGQSEGSYGKGFGETLDCIAVVKWAKQQWPNAELWLTGFSFGSFVSANAAQQLQPEQLITVAPAVTSHDYSVLEVPCPWLVLQGEQDEVVNPQEVYNWFETVTTPKQLIKFPDTDHFFHGKLVDLEKAICEHFS